MVRRLKGLIKQLIGSERNKRNIGGELRFVFKNLDDFKIFGNSRVDQGAVAMSFMFIPLSRKLTQLRMEECKSQNEEETEYYPFSSIFVE